MLQLSLVCRTKPTRMMPSFVLHCNQQYNNTYVAFATGQQQTSNAGSCVSMFVSQFVMKKSCVQSNTRDGPLQQSWTQLPLCLLDMMDHDWWNVSNDSSRTMTFPRPTFKAQILAWKVGKRCGHALCVTAPCGPLSVPISGPVSGTQIVVPVNCSCMRDAWPTSW
jgi:hypothetical protein